MFDFLGNNLPVLKSYLRRLESGESRAEALSDIQYYKAERTSKLPPGPRWRDVPLSGDLFLLAEKYLLREKTKTVVHPGGEYIAPYDPKGPMPYDTSYCFEYVLRKDLGKVVVKIVTFAKLDHIKSGADLDFLRGAKLAGHLFKTREDARAAAKVIYPHIAILD